LVLGGLWQLNFTAVYYLAVNLMAP